VRQAFRRLGVQVAALALVTVGGCGALVLGAAGGLRAFEEATDAAAHYHNVLLREAGLDLHIQEAVGSARGFLVSQAGFDLELLATAAPRPAPRADRDQPC
jgi:hypothetical protein